MTDYHDCNISLPFFLFSGPSVPLTQKSSTIDHIYSGPPGCNFILSFVAKACADQLPFFFSYTKKKNKPCDIHVVYSSFILKEDLHCARSKKPGTMGKRDLRRIIWPLQSIVSCHTQMREWSI